MSHIDTKEGGRISLFVLKTFFHENGINNKYFFVFPSGLGDLLRKILFLYQLYLI